MTVRPCLGCGELTPATRCPRCRRARDRAHPNPRNDRRYRAAARTAIAEHVRKHGWVCLGGPGHPAHETHDLTADHPIRLADGGALIQAFDVVCRSLNSERGARAGRDRA